ncbi:C3a anaphylatoxin chemotactic receptor-like [Esox lucius]|uniref:C3a anaphylatoxin chemotactic receptor-like n=1 Tax=Esox lucius TaxID=8010 RepID=UPI001476FA1C|nr:C3a anaphylatoxin chemotactic receptor-like [Esox lucius]
MEENGNYTYYDYYDNILVYAAFINIHGFYIFYLVVCILTFLVGVPGNGLVIWITGLKMKKTVNTTWYLSLAVSDFIFCATFPTFHIIIIVTRGSIFLFFTIALMLISMFINVFLLVIICVDHCVSVVFPVWAQNNCTINKASIVVILTWVSSVALITRFPLAVKIDMEKILQSQFIGGFAVPFLIIIFCYSVIILQLRTRRMISVSSKSLRVMTALIAMFFICWLPIVTVILFNWNKIYSELRVDVIRILVGIIFASVHSFLRPVLYVCMGNNVPRTLKRSIVGRIENFLGEDDPPTTSHETSTHL